MLRKLIAWRYHIRIRDRLIAYFLLAIVIPTSIITLFLYQRTTDLVTRKMNDQAHENLVSISALVREKLNFVNDLSTLININPNLQAVFMAPPPQTATEIVREITTLDSILESYYLSSNYLFLGSGISPRLYMVGRSSYKRAAVSATPKVFDVGDIAHEDWYQCLSNGFTVVGVVQDAAGGQSEPHLRVARRMYNTKKTETVVFAAVLVVDIDIHNMASMLTPYKPTTASTLYVADADTGSVLLSTDFDAIGQTVPVAGEPMPTSDQALRTMDIGGARHLITEQPIDGLDLTVFATTPLAQINAEQIALNRTLLALVVGSMAIAFCIAMVLSKSIATPIQTLAHSMQAMPNEDFAIAIQYKRHDEFGALIDRYREMIAQIKQLIEELYISDLNKKGAELKAKDAELIALQAQINPHFLYNTLDAINLYAIKHRVPEISEMISALSDFFRYALSKGKKIIPLSDELITVESYLKIQKIRLGDMLHYTIDVDEDVRQNLIAKFVIQPLVENAIVHGIQPTGKPGHISIRAYKVGDTMQITVRDGGGGADVEDLHEMLAAGIPAVRERSFGIRNVNDRIRTLFGEAYGLRFASPEDGGLCATLTLPNIRTMEGYHVHHDHRG